MSSKAKTPKKKKVRTASKTTASYWMDTIRLETKPGWQSSNYFARILAHGLRKKVRLDSSVKEEAAREAADLYISVLANGWPGEDDNQLSVPGISGLPEKTTIQDWCAAVKKKTKAREESVDKYGESLRTIVGEVLGTPRARKPEQRAKINAFLISDLTKETLMKWYDARMEKARTSDKLQSGRAQNTLRSVLANAKALFCSDVLKAMEITDEMMPKVPFSSLKLPPKVKRRYTSRFDPISLLACAVKELGNESEEGEDAESRFEQWKIIYLALVAGLRYNEIDKLRVHDIMPAACRISIRTHDDFVPKTDSSEGDIQVNTVAAKVLEGMIKQTKGQWFIKAGVSKQSPKYRAGLYHDAALSWLRNYEERGYKPLADIPKPLHELRKEAGTLVKAAHGLDEAQRFLRHKSITTTAEFYVGSKGETNTGIA